MLLSPTMYCSVNSTMFALVIKLPVDRTKYYCDTAVFSRCARRSVPRETAALRPPPRWAGHAGCPKYRKAPRGEKLVQSLPALSIPFFPRRAACAPGKSMPPSQPVGGPWRALADPRGDRQSAISRNQGGLSAASALGGPAALQRTALARARTVGHDQGGGRRELFRVPLGRGGEQGSRPLSSRQGA